MIYAIGDIHGCLKTLQALLKKLPYQKDDLLVFLGDYIDRGPDSKGVLEFLMQFMHEHPHVVYLRGNHEEMCVRALKTQSKEAYAHWFENAGEATLNSYHGQFDGVHALMLQSLPLTYETDEYFFCHAGVDANFPLYEQPKETLLWMRKPFIHSTVDYGKVIVFGHSYMEKVLITPNKIGLDTGCSQGKKLSAIALPTLEVYDHVCVDSI